MQNKQKDFENAEYESALKAAGGHAQVAEVKAPEEPPIHFHAGADENVYDMAAKMISNDASAGSAYAEVDNSPSSGALIMNPSGINMHDQPKVKVVEIQANGALKTQKAEAKAISLKNK